MGNLFMEIFVKRRKSNPGTFSLYILFQKNLSRKMNENPSAGEHGLRLASTIRFVYTKKNKEPKTVDVRKTTKPEGKRRGRESQSGFRTDKTKAEQIADETKKVKAEWGRAFKHMNDGKESTFPIFLEISNTGECAQDPFFQKMFREMAFGSFPKGVFYDKNRDCLVCTEMSGRRNSSFRQTKLEKFIRVCIPNRMIIGESSGMMTRTTDQPSREQTRDTEAEITLEIKDKRELMEKKAIKYIHLCNQRLELPILILQSKYGLSLNRIFEEIKLFLYSTIDVISPWDANNLQEDSYQTMQIKERVTSLKPQRPWKKLTQLEQISMVCQFCRIIFFHIFRRAMDSLTVQQERVLKNVKDYLCGLVAIGFIPPQAIEFDGTIRKIHGVEISSSGIKIDEQELDKYREPPSEKHDETRIVPVSIQKFKTVDLQKIQNGIYKQQIKTSKMIRILTESMLDELST